MDPPKRRFNILSSGETKDQLKARIETLETITASLEKLVQDEKGRTQHQRNAHDITLKELRGKNEICAKQNSQIETLEAALSRLGSENDGLYAQVEDTAKLRREQVVAEASLKKELAGSQIDGQRLTRDLEDSRTQFKEREKQLKLQQQKVDRLHSENLTLEQSNLELERKVAWLNKQRNVLDLGSFDDWLLLGKEKADLERRLREKEDLTESQNLTAERNTELIDNLQKTVSSLEKQLQATRQTKPLNLRSLLHMRIIEAATIPQDNRPSGGLWRPAISGNKALDDNLNPTELQEYSQLLILQPSTLPFYRTLHIIMCALCGSPRFRPTKPTVPPINLLAEFPARSTYFPCCHELVCKQCVAEHISHSVEYDWWFRLDTLQWLLCPREDCKSPLGIRCEADLEVFLGRNGCTYTDKVVSNFGRSIVLRESLAELDPKPTDAAIKIAASLHAHLIANKVMDNFSDDRFTPLIADESGCLPDFVPGAVMRGDTDEESRIPIFLRFLRRQREPRICAICSIPKYEIQYGDVDSWKDVCQSYGGSWMWKILIYPTREILGCDHDFDVCRACISSHISSLIETGGVTACDRIACVQCSRKLTYEEVTHFADPSATEKYEKFLLLKHLSSEENFRWCTRSNPPCVSGQIYDNTRGSRDIKCNECNFLMCFSCGRERHPNITCEEAESKALENDPNYQMFVQYLKENGKNCPSCDTTFVKGKECFHMTCTCGHQFCYACLVDWAKIRNGGLSAHNEDCFFRIHGINPVSVRGESLDAIRRPL